jgi:hypothetical protein
MANGKANKRKALEIAMKMRRFKFEVRKDAPKKPC